MRTLPLWRTLGFVLTLLCAVPAQAETDPAAVRESFDAYKQALMAGDGPTASRLTASDTHAFLGETLDRALTLREEELRGLPLFDQIAVLMLRHNMPADQLRAMAKDDLVAFAVSQQAFDLAEVEKLSAEPFVVNGDRARAELSKLKGSPIPVSVHFREEGGTWRFDLMQSIAPFRAFFEAQAGLLSKVQTSDGKNAVVPLIIHLFTGRAPGPDIWNPPG